MARFTEIERVNSYGEKGKALVDLDNLVGMKEIHVEPVKLYDEDGNLVSETPKPKEFTIHFTVGETFHIYEEEYQRIVNLLTKTEGN